MNNWIWLIVVGAFSLPTFITGFAFWLIQRRITKSDNSRAKREECLIGYQIMLINTSFASVALGKATAVAVRDGKTNGEMREAFEQVAEVEKMQKDYLNKQAVEHIF